MKNILPLLLSLFFVAACVQAEADTESSEGDQIERRPPTDSWGKRQALIINLAQSGKGQEAEAECKRAIEDAKAAGKTDLLSPLFNLLAFTYRVQGRIEEAIQTYKQSIVLLQKSEEASSHPDRNRIVIAVTRCTISELYIAANQFDLALAQLIKAKPKLTSKDPEYTVFLQDLGTAFAGLNRDQEAEASFKKAINLCNAGEPPNNPIGAVNSSYSLALLYANKKQFPALSALLKTAIPLSEKQLGPSHHVTKKFRNLGVPLEEQLVADTQMTKFMEDGLNARKANDLPKSISNFENAVKASEKAGPNSMARGNALFSLGVSQVDSGKISEGAANILLGEKILERYLEDDSAALKAVKSVSTKIKEKSTSKNDLSSDKAQ